MLSGPAIKELVSNLNPTEIACLKTLTTGAMSYGSISLEAHKTIAEGVNLLAMAVHNLDLDPKHEKESIAALRKMGMKGTPLSNSGEGGELPNRDNTIYESRGRQVASGRFGVNGTYLAHAGLIQIKVNQAAKPGLGGELPGTKVTVEVAEARGTQAGTTLISPPPHHDIYSIEQLKELIQNLRSANPDADISVKLAAGEGIGVIAAGVVKTGANHISIAGQGGGTGAAPLIAKYEFVLPWETALAEVHKKLTSEGLRQSVKLTVSGGIQTGEDVFKALLLGVDYAELGTSVLVSLGCVMAEHCHDGKCPAGIATTDKEHVEKTFKGKAVDVAAFLIRIAKSMNTYLEQYGFTDPSQVIGRTDLLKVSKSSPLKGLENLLEEMKNPYPDFKPLQPPAGSSATEQDVIQQIIAGKKEISCEAKSCDLSFGARINYHKVTNSTFAKQFIEPITVRFNGLAVGQSFGFLAPQNLRLIAKRSNDNAGKSLDGGEIYVHTAGNQALYGATRGLFCARYVGDRAAVRNSGATLIAEGVGDMAANFMTGGAIILLGSPTYYEHTKINASFTSPVGLRKKIVGPNFGAGFTGGQIYLPKKLYKEMYDNGYLSTDTLMLKPQPMTAEDKPKISALLNRYTDHIASPWVKDIAANPDFHLDFVKLNPSVKEPNFKSLSKEKKPSPNTLPPMQRVNRTEASSLPASQPLTTPPASRSPIEERDSCGVGAYFNLQGKSSYETTDKIITMLERFKHRGATGIDPKTGDGTGIAWYGLDAFFQKQFPKVELQKGRYSILSLFASNVDPDKQKTFAALQAALSRENLSIATDQIRRVPTNRAVLGPIGQQQESDNYQLVVLKPENLSQEEFEKKLARARLYFELTEAQNENYRVKPHLASASSYHLVYKTLATEDNIRQYFLDLQDPDFQSNGGVDHTRFSTNVLSSSGGVHPHNNILANNGENNALAMITDLMTNHPLFKQLFGVDKINLKGFSDSRIMSIYLSALALLDYPIEKMVASTIQAYDPIDTTSRVYYNLFATRFLGPNASVIMLKDKVAFIRDENGFRPLRGMANDHEFYAGSELGAVNLSGEVFDLPPGKTLILDLKTGSFSVYEPDEKLHQFQKQQLSQLRLCIPPEDQKPLVEFTKEEFLLRRLQVGWNEEFNKMQMQPLFKGEKNISSMGDQGPIEAAVKGQFLDLNQFLKGKFSQVTNPPLANLQEKGYMSLETFIGRKPKLTELDNTLVEGFLLDTPVLDNEEFAFLHQGLGNTVETIDTTIECADEPPSQEDFLKLIEKLKEDCIQRVKEGATTLVLSDLKVDMNRMAIHPTLITSIVHDALLKAGLRQDVSLIVQSGHIRTGSDTAKAISFGADAVNPYLPCSLKESKKHFKEQLNLELQSHMARMGISSVSAYRGVRGFTGYGMSQDLAELFGIHSELQEPGGFGIKKMLQNAWNNHHFPEKKGLGKWDKDEPQPHRVKKWHPGVTRALLNSRSNEDRSEVEQQQSFNHYEAESRKISGQPRSFLDLAPATHWSKTNPMPVCIIGGGAAGFYQAQALLDSGLPVKITIIEKKLVNKFGLLGDGVAPDHIGTKNQGKILRQLLKDPRVEYVGGIEIGKDISLEELKKDYPCVIDCSGAEMDNRLNVSGEELATPASAVYKSYNGEFNPLRESNWPFAENSTNTAIGIIGNGNVAADTAKILLANPDELEDKAGKLINPEFLAQLRTEGPRIVHVIARNNPLESKMSLASLRELADLPDVEISTSYNLNSIKPENLTDSQKELYEFFISLAHRACSQPNKKLVFHFDMEAKDFQINAEREGIKAGFLDKNNIKEPKFITARNFVTAIGTTKVAQTDSIAYRSGWAAGKGGTLPVAENSAQTTAETIKQDYIKENFPVKSSSFSRWRLKKPIDKDIFTNMLNWMEDRGEITQDNFDLAKHYQRNNMLSSHNSSTTNLESKDQSWVDLTQAALDLEPIPGQVVIHSAKNGVTHIPIPQNNNATILRLLKDKMGTKAPKVSCDGGQTCSECAAQVITSKGNISLGKKEKQTLEVNGYNPKLFILSCAHKPNESTDIEDLVLALPETGQKARNT